MPLVRDFRRYKFEAGRIDRCGRFVGKHTYWQLFAIENILRIVIHSVLTVQAPPPWWATAVDPWVQKQAAKRMNDYAAKPNHTSPGTHGINYVLLSDLTNIVRANSHYFLPVIPDIDQWVARLEKLRLSRNLVGHMTFPNAFDKNQIEAFYKDLPLLIQKLEAHPVPVLIP